MVITYNHSRYLGRALDSILSQKVDFDFVIHVVDDCSTDGAQDIIRRYAAEHPGVVIPFINKKNIGRKVTQRNFIRGFKRLNADYIAILEGDDYWTDDNKLKSQIDFLESHPDYVGCGHNVMKVYDDGSEAHLFLPPPEREWFDIHDFIMMRAYIHTSSLTYRHVLHRRTPRQFRNKLSCDIFITTAHAQYGKIRFDPKPMSVYRAHGGGVFSNMSPTAGWIFNIDGMRRYNAWLGYRYWRTYAEALYLYCEYLLRNGKPEEGLSPWARFKYGQLARFYKALYRLGQRFPAKA